MKRYAIAFAPEAEADLLAIYDWIADAGSAITAIRYIDRIEAFCTGFKHFPERGTLRENIRPGLRIIGFERRITIAFIVEEDRVVFLRVFYGGRDWEQIMSNEKA